jgi:hypothetical protein
MRAGPPGARRLLIEVRDTPPVDKPSFYRGADRSFIVSTGGAGERDDMPTAGEADNGFTRGAGNAIRQVHVREGEPVRVDLPTTQSLQFHAPGRSASSASGSGADPAPVARGGSAAGGANLPSVSGVVYFEAVAAFSARFALLGSRVRVELVPLRVGNVAAPWNDGGSHHSGPIVLQGRVGEWIALGDTELPAAKNLNATAEPPSPAAVWVRVFPQSEAAGADATNRDAADRSTVVGTGQRP